MESMRKYFAVEYFQNLTLISENDHNLVFRDSETVHVS